ncbi:2394_t:CDS:1, partial [Paraglomus occultum]
SRIFLTYDIDQPRMEERRTTITKGTDALWDEETQFAVFQRCRTSITFRLVRRGLFGMMTPIGKGEYPLRNLQSCVNHEVEIPLFDMMLGHIPDTVTDDTSSQVCGRLRFTLHFYPGFAPIHEREIERSLTGVEASILKNNLARTIEQESVSVPEDEEAFHVGKERRLHKIHRKKYIRQLQFVSDEMMDKLHAVTGQKNWDDYREVVEREA